MRNHKLMHVMVKIIPQWIELFKSINLEKIMLAELL